MLFVRLLLLLIALLSPGLGRDGSQIAAGATDAPVAAGPLEKATRAVDNGDYATELRLLRELADQGDADAQYNLGVMHFVGQGMAKDDVEAAKLFREAAEQRNADAQNDLGAMYGEGQGVPRDLIRAYTWFSLAAIAGNQSAANNRDIAAQHMTAGEIAEAKRLVTEAKPGK
jgi:uncharacterized protein